VNVVLHYTDTGGLQMTIAEFYHAHGRSRVARDQAAGFKVYDDREAS
jgi:hypothetical protein